MDFSPNTNNMEPSPADSLQRLLDSEPDNTNAEPQAPLGLDALRPLSPLGVSASVPAPQRALELSPLSTPITYRDADGAEQTTTVFDILALARDLKYQKMGAGWLGVSALAGLDAIHGALWVLLQHYVASLEDLIRGTPTQDQVEKLGRTLWDCLRFMYKREESLQEEGSDADVNGDVAIFVIQHINVLPRIAANNAQRLVTKIKTIEDAVKAQYPGTFVYPKDTTQIGAGSQLLPQLGPQPLPQLGPQLQAEFWTEPVRQRRPRSRTKKESGDLVGRKTKKQPRKDKNKLTPEEKDLAKQMHHAGNAIRNATVVGIEGPAREFLFTRHRLVVPDASGHKGAAQHQKTVDLQACLVRHGDAISYSDAPNFPGPATPLGSPRPGNTFKEIDSDVSSSDTKSSDGVELARKKKVSKDVREQRRARLPRDGSPAEASAKRPKRTQLELPSFFSSGSLSDVSSDESEKKAQTNGSEHPQLSSPSPPKGAPFVTTSQLADMSSSDMSSSDDESEPEEPLKTAGEVLAELAAQKAAEQRKTEEVPAESAAQEAAEQQKMEEVLAKWKKDGEPDGSGASDPDCWVVEPASAPAASTGTAEDGNLTGQNAPPVDKGKGRESDSPAKRSKAQPRPALELDSSSWSSSSRSSSGSDSSGSDSSDEAEAPPAPAPKKSSGSSDEAEAPSAPAPKKSSDSPAKRPKLVPSAPVAQKRPTRSRRSTRDLLDARLVAGLAKPLETAKLIAHLLNQREGEPDIDRGLLKDQLVAGVHSARINWINYVIRTLEMPGIIEDGEIFVNEGDEGQTALAFLNELLGLGLGEVTL
jgi:hypothetical protein